MLAGRPWWRFGAEVQHAFYIVLAIVEVNRGSI
jgi:hypothetical protein